MSRVLLPALLAPVLAAVLVVGGCADDGRPTSSSTAADGDRDDGRRSQAERTPSSTPSPTDPPEEQETSSDSRSQKPHKVGRLGTPVARTDGAWGHLLAADRMPAAHGAVVWTVAGTQSEDGEQTGACQKTSLVDLGAVRAVRRDYAGADDSSFRARQVVARFADPRSAWRASKVLASWRDDCADRLDYPRKDVGPMEEVATDPATAGRYPLTYGSRRSQETAELGIVRKGRWLTVIEIAADHESYPDDHLPGRRAVRKIAATFA